MNDSVQALSYEIALLATLCRALVSMLKIGQPFPTSGRRKKGIKTKKNGSYGLNFKLNPPKRFESNWVEIVPGKGWFVELRLSPGSKRPESQERSDS